MQNVQISTTFCEKIIHHQGEDRYSLIGVIPSAITVDSFPYKIKELWLDIAITIPIDTSFPYDEKIEVLILVGKDCVLRMPMPALDKEIIGNFLEQENSINNKVTMKTQDFIIDLEIKDEALISTQLSIGAQTYLGDCIRVAKAN